MSHGNENEEHGGKSATATADDHKNHEADLQHVQDRIEHDLDKHDYNHVFEELTKLRKEDKDKGVDFAEDLKKIDEKLKKDGYLPGMTIAIDEKTGDLILKATGDAPPPDAPHHDEPQGGYSRHGGNRGGGGHGYGGGSGFGGDVGGDGGVVTKHGSSEGGDMPASGSRSIWAYSEDDMTEEEKAIAASLDNYVGDAMWTEYGGTNNGREGCAASASEVLSDIEHKYGLDLGHLSPGQGDALCTTMQKDLMAQGWTVTDKPHPGDVVIGYGGLSSAHTGIVGKNGMVFDNHSSSGHWSKDHLSYFSNWNKLVFLRPPDARHHA
jgi:hypothetical protein